MLLSKKNLYRETLLDGRDSDGKLTLPRKV